MKRHTLLGMVKESYWIQVVLLLTGAVGLVLVVALLVPPAVSPVTAQTTAGLWSLNNIGTATPSPTPYATPYQQVQTVQAVGVESEVCTYGAQYWSEHPERWPAQHLILGRLSYTQEQAQAILRSGAQDGRGYFLQQLVTAMLNQLNGASAPGLAQTLTQAEIWIEISQDQISDATLLQGQELVQALEDFNHGRSGSTFCQGQVTPTPAATATLVPSPTPTAFYGSYDPSFPAFVPVGRPDEDRPGGSNAPPPPPPASEPPSDPPATDGSGDGASGGGSGDSGGNDGGNDGGGNDGGGGDGDQDGGDGGDNGGGGDGDHDGGNDGGDNDGGGGDNDDDDDDKDDDDKDDDDDDKDDDHDDAAPLTDAVDAVIDFLEGILG